MQNSTVYIGLLVRWRPSDVDPDQVRSDHDDVFADDMIVVEHSGYALCPIVTLRKIAAVLRVNPTDLNGWRSAEVKARPDAAELRERAKHIDLLERFNARYPTPVWDEDDDNQDYPVLSALAAYYLAGQAGTIADFDLEMDEPIWLGVLTLWVRLRVVGNTAWMQAMSATFKLVADRFENGDGYGRLKNHAERVGSLRPEPRISRAIRMARARTTCSVDAWMISRPSRSSSKKTWKRTLTTSCARARRQWAGPADVAVPAP